MGTCTDTVSFQYIIQGITDTHIYRPANPQELFNLRHASARNVIERIFGILKRRFRILLLSPEYDMGIQAQVPPALCALHNFIRYHDPSEITDFDDVCNHGVGAELGELATGAVGPPE